MINYYLITKPGIIMGNLITLAAGFYLGGQGNFELFLATLIGLGLIIASSCVINNYIDRDLDKKMERTQNRALAQNLISEKNALAFAAILGFSGAGTLYLFTNILALGLALTGFFIYIFLYTLSKRHTVYGTAIGSVAGAIPPVVGYCAASGTLDLAAAILFAILVLWQMPHFFAIALFRLEDYAKANVPVLPLARGIFRTKLHMVIYILCLIPTVMSLTLFGYSSPLLAWTAVIIGLLWLALALYGFRVKDDKRWGKQMFFTSLIAIGAICLVMPF